MTKLPVDGVDSGVATPNGIRGRCHANGFGDHRCIRVDRHEGAHWFLERKQPDAEPISDSSPSGASGTEATFGDDRSASAKEAGRDVRACPWCGEIPRISGPMALVLCDNPKCWLSYAGRSVALAAWNQRASAPAGREPPDAWLVSDEHCNETVYPDLHDAENAVDGTDNEIIPLYRRHSRSSEKPST